MKRRGKSILRDRPGVIWLLGLALLGLVAAYVIRNAIHSAEKSVTVTVASQTIPEDTVITPKELKSVNISASVMPSGVILNPQAIIGKYADMTIGQGAPILASNVAPASTVRELIRTYGMNFIGAGVQLDPSDLPINQVNPGDIVDLAGVYGVQNQDVSTQWIATGVPVLSVDVTDSKIVLAIPRDDALSLIRDFTVGKVRVFLDPNPFQGAVTFQDSSSSKLTAQGASNSPALSGISGAASSSVQTPGRNAVKISKPVKTVERSTLSTAP